jgi:hypothetical protein
MLYWYQNTDDGDGGLGKVVEVGAAAVVPLLFPFFAQITRNQCKICVDYLVRDAMRRFEGGPILAILGWRPHITPLRGHRSANQNFQTSPIQLQFRLSITPYILITYLALITPNSTVH